MLHGVEFGRPNEGSKVSARALRIEFALGALMRGEWRIAEARLEGPELAAGLDGSGRIAWPLPKLGFDLEGVSIERLQIEDGRAVLTDAASDTRLVLEKLEFRGELRSLAGPVKGDGSFVVAGQRYPYRVSTGRIAEDGGVKVRLAVESTAASADHRRGPHDLDRAGHAAFRGQRSIGAAGGPRSRRRAGAHHRLLARHQPHQGRQHGGPAGSDRIPVRAGRQGDQASGQRQSHVRPRSRRSTAPCRRRRSTSTACWRCPTQRAADHCPPSKTLAETLIPHVAAADPDDAEHCGRERDARGHDAGARERRCEIRRAMAWRSRRWSCARRARRSCVSAGASARRRRACGLRDRLRSRPTIRARSLPG